MVTTMVAVNRDSTPQAAKPEPLDEEEEESDSSSMVFLTSEEAEEKKPVAREQVTKTFFFFSKRKKQRKHRLTTSIPYFLSFLLYQPLLNFSNTTCCFFRNLPGVALESKWK